MKTEQEIREKIEYIKQAVSNNQFNDEWCEFWGVKIKILEWVLKDSEK